MDCILTLIALDGIDDSTADAARSALVALGAEVAPPDWLAPGRAVDLAFAGPSLDRATAAVRRALEGRPVDVAAQPVADRRKGLLLADMDSTIVTGETLDELADFAGLKDHIAAITARAMNGEIDFKAAVRERVGLLAGLSADSLEGAWRRIRFTPGGHTLVATMRAHGARTILVSGGFSYFTARVRDACGFDADRSNQLEIADGRLTGRVIEPILDRDAKLRTLHEESAKAGLPLARALTVGDGANDLDMIRAAGLGVAFHAKPSVAAAAGIRIDHGDLTALLFLQGYRTTDFSD